MIEAAPKPEVQHLPTIFRRVASGEICIPAFQREFVWKSSQILSLLDSVYRGFPISSLLFWRVNTARLKVQDKRNFPTISANAPFPRSFVLDGQQRLTTLYGVFNFNEDQFDDIFNVFFDLWSEEFHLVSEVRELEPHQLRLEYVFNPRSFLEAQRSLLELPGGSKLVDNAIRLHSTFQEYLVPLVTIESEDVQDVVRIFERINNSGTNLSSVDFMRAVTWSEDFDLSTELEKVVEHFQDSGFTFEDEALVKCLAVALDRDPTATSMMTLQACNNAELHGAVEVVVQALTALVSFFKRNFEMLSSDFIAYEAQVVVLAHLFAKLSGPDIEDVARRWFLGTAINEELRGRSDAFVSNLIRDINRFSAGADDSISTVLESVAFNLPDVLFERRFIKGRALSAAIPLLFALRGARSIRSNEIISPSEYLRGFVPTAFQPILPSMPFGRSGSYGSHRRIANLALVADDDRFETGLSGYITSNLATIPVATLESQFINKRAMESLLARDAMEFAFARAESMMTFAEELIDGSIEWPFH